MVSSITNMKKKFNKLCSPAQFYLVLSLFSLVIYLVNMLEHKNKMNTASGLIVQTIVVILWTCILNWVCSFKNGSNIAWFLVFLPLLLVLVLLLVMYHFIDTMDLSKEDLKELIQQSNEDQIEGFCDECG